jgi:hypothetical protein
LLRQDIEFPNGLVIGLADDKIFRLAQYDSFIFLEGLVILFWFGHDLGRFDVFG